MPPVEFEQPWRNHLEVHERTLHIKRRQGRKLRRALRNVFHHLQMKTDWPLLEYYRSRRPDPKWFKWNGNRNQMQFAEN